VEISDGTIQLLASALLQLVPVLGLALIWTESQLSGSSKVLDQEGSTGPRPDDKVGLHVGRQEGVILGLAVVTFLHSISWSIVALAIPSRWVISIALLNGLIFLMIATVRIATSSLPKSKVFRTIVIISIVTVWVPVSQLFGIIVGTSPVSPNPSPTVTASTTP
jgi:hypothetical protein